MRFPCQNMSTQSKTMLLKVFFAVALEGNQLHEGRNCFRDETVWIKKSSESKVCAAVSVTYMKPAV